MGHIDLSAKLKIVIGRTDGFLYTRNHYGICRYILAGESVAAGLRGLQTHSSFSVTPVSERHRQAVDFLFNGKLGVRMHSQHLLHPLRDILIVKNILDRKHRYIVDNLYARFPFCDSADNLRRRIRRNPFRMFFFGCL